MKLIMHLREGPIPNSGGPVPDTAETTWDGQRYEAKSAHGATMALARMLVGAGCPDCAWEVPGRLYGPSLHRLARLTLAEGDKGIRVVPYREFTRSPVRGGAQDGVEASGWGVRNPRTPAGPGAAQASERR